VLGVSAVVARACHKLATFARRTSTPTNEENPSLEDMLGLVALTRFEDLVGKLLLLLLPPPLLPPLLLSIQWEEASRAFDVSLFVHVCLFHGSRKVHVICMLWAVNAVPTLPGGPQGTEQYWTSGSISWRAPCTRRLSSGSMSGPSQRCAWCCCTCPWSLPRATPTTRESALW